MVRLADLLEGFEATYVGCGPELGLSALRSDSRLVGPGAAFIALRGATHDGHRFVDTAFAAGASLVIVDARADTPSGPHVVLPDTGAALPQLAASMHGWPQRSLRLAGITGTNGKTTTTHLLEAVLRAADRKFARLGTTGNWLVDHEAPAAFTTPFPLELQALLGDARDRGATDVLMEVSSHALDQDRVEPLRFEAVGMTSFSQDHLDYHPDMDAYLRAKLRLAEHFLVEGGTVAAAVDADPTSAARFLDAATAASQVLRCSRGRDPSAEIFAKDWAIDASGTRARVRTPLGEFELQSRMVGVFNLDNALVTTGLAIGLGIDLGPIAAGLSETPGAPGRLERVRSSHESSAPNEPGPAVFVDYAHTPDAVARAIEALRPTCSGRLIVLLGCGGDRDQSKRPIMGRVASEGADVFYATSDNPRTEDPAFIVDQMLAGTSSARTIVRMVDRAQAIATAIADCSDEDTILIAGKGHEDYQILGTTKIHFDDREHAASALARRRERSA